MAAFMLFEMRRPDASRRFACLIQRLARAELLAERLLVDEPRRRRHERVVHAERLAACPAPARIVVVSDALDEFHKPIDRGLDGVSRMLAHGSLCRIAAQLDDAPPTLP